MGGGDDGESHIGSTRDETSTQDSDERENPQSQATDFGQEEDSDEEEKKSEMVSNGGSSAGGAGAASGAAFLEFSPDVETGSEEPSEQEQESGSSAEGELGESESDNHDEAVQIVVYSDPWDNIGWGLYPVLYRLKEEYGKQIQIDERLVPVREFDSPEEMIEKWGKDSRRHQMPVNTSVWESDPPVSTAMSNRAYAAARQQGVALARKYFRRLRVASIVEGVNIENRDALISLAEEVGVDSQQLKEDWEEVSVQKSAQEVQIPKTRMYIDEETPTWSGYLHIDDLYMPIEQMGIEQKEPRPIRDFVKRYGPVAVKEIQQVYELSRQDALRKLEGAEGVTSTAYGETELWVGE